MTREEALSLLGLQPGASRSEILVAHRELAQMLHPDKFEDNAKLRDRAEQQMRRINEARDVLLGGSAKSSSRPRPSTGSRQQSRTAPSTPGEIRMVAEARAHAAETARLTVVAHLRTQRERRRSMLTMAVIAAVVTFFFMHMRGSFGTLVFSIASMVLVWGVVDVFILSSSIRVLEKRARDLLHTRDAALEIARQAAEL